MTLVQKAKLKVLALLRAHTSSSPPGLVTVIGDGKRRSRSRQSSMPERQRFVSHKLPLLKKSYRESTQLALVAGCFFSPLCSRCFTHEFGEFAVEPQWILKKGGVSGFGVPGRGTGPTFLEDLITHGREDHRVAQTLSH